MKITVEVNEKIVVTSTSDGKSPCEVVLMIGGQVVNVDGRDLIAAIEKCQYSESFNGETGLYWRRGARGTYCV